MNGYDNDDFDSAVLDRAQRKVRLPGLLLIITGVFGLLLTLVYLAPLLNLAEYFKQQRDMINQNPGLDAGQKQQFIAYIDQMEPDAVPYIITVGAVSGISSLIVMIGGIKLRNLSSKGWAMAGSVIAMLPCCVIYCCVVGLPVGIWAFIVMGNPDVKAAFARNRLPASGNDFDSYPPPV